jgi:hypothetical protein
VERRLSVTASIALAVAGLLGALGILLLGRRTSPDEIHAIAGDLDALIRESAAGVKERAETLSQLPRISWAVATDAATVRDLTNDELAFRTHPGEHIEITQMPKGGGEPRRLLQRPPDSGLDLPLTPGTHVVVLANHLQVVTAVSIEPRERAEQMVGILAVAKELDTSALEQRLAARRINAEVRTIQGAVVLAGAAPGGSAQATIPLAGPAAEGVVLIAANLGTARWPYVVAPLVLVLALGGAALLARKGASAARPARARAPYFPAPSPPVVNAPVPPASPEPAPADIPPPAAPSTVQPARSPYPSPGARPTPLATPALDAGAVPSEKRLPRPATPPLGASALPSEKRLPRPATPPLGASALPSEKRLPRPATPPLGASALPSEKRPPRLPTPGFGAKATPVAGMPSIPEDAIPFSADVRLDQGQSGRVEISLTRTGSVSLPARGAGLFPPPADAKAAPDPHVDAYRTLFAEFVRMRKTTGESIDELDVAQFVETLRQKRAQIMKQIPVRDVKFKLAFHNGKAAIRFLTVT